MNVNAGTVSHFSECLTHAMFSPELPITAQVLAVLVSLALPSAYPLCALTHQQRASASHPHC